MKKPELAEVHEFLRRHNALIVHFSGAPKGSGIERDGHHFPEDLNHVLKGAAMGGLSCSVVVPSDVFHGFDRNATGCVGVVLGLRTKDSLVAVDPGDCGSMEDEETGIREVMSERDITVADLGRTLSEREGYNEWVVKDYVVLGIFAVPPLEVSIMKPPEYPPDVPMEMRDLTPIPHIVRIPPEEMTGMFAEQAMYSFIKNAIHCRREGRFYPVAHFEIYRDPTAP